MTAKIIITIDDIDYKSMNVKISKKVEKASLSEAIIANNLNRVVLEERALLFSDAKEVHDARSND